MKSYTDFIVDISQIRANISNIKKYIGSNTKFCAVVKANAYSHGLISLSMQIADMVDYFAVACLKEAVTIRLYNKVTPILILSRVERSNLAWCRENRVSISISSLSQLKEYGDDCKGVFLHLQVNTGLNRFGFRSLIEFKKTIEYIEDRGLLLEGVYSHFATKEDDKTFIKRQNFKFKQFKKLVKSDNVIFHIANSFATVSGENYKYDMVRNGFLMYGLCGEEIGNKPALEISSRIINITTVRKGETVGYDRTYKTDKAIRVAVVPVGYADGLDRRLSNNFSVLILGRRCNIVGLICMDVFMVDVSGLDVSIGDRVVLLGKDGDKEITISDYAKTLGISPYAVLLSFNYKRMNYILKNKYTNIIINIH